MSIKMGVALGLDGSWQAEVGGTYQRHEDREQPAVPEVPESAAEEECELLVVHLNLTEKWKDGENKRCAEGCRLKAHGIEQDRRGIDGHTLTDFIVLSLVS